MLKSNGFRIILLLILIGGLVAIVWSYRSRSNDRSEGPERSLLSPEITRQSTEFEYTQLREGRIQFRVTAESSTLTREGTHRLEGVRLYRYGPENKPTDAVRSDVAIYQPEAKEIEFEDDVRIELVDGTRIFAEWAGGDLSAEIVTIRERFEFQREEVRGEGEGLRYQIEERVLEVAKSFESWIPTESEGLVTARSGAVTYWLTEGRARLTGGVKIFSELYELSADRVQVLMDENRGVSVLEAQQDARLQISESQAFYGAEIVLQPKEEEYLLEVRSTQSGGAITEKAVYEEHGADGEHYLEAVAIRTEFLRREGDVSSSPRILISSLTAQEDVLFRSSSQGIDEGRASSFAATFDAEGTQFQTIDLREEVRLVRRSEASGGFQTETILSGNLEIVFHGSGSMDFMRAEQDVEILVEDSEGGRELFADDFVQMEYENGFLIRMDARGNCRLHEATEQSGRSINAPSIQAFFEGAQLTSLNAFPTVALALEGDEGLRNSQSRTLLLEYEAGKMAKVVQVGNVKMWRESETGRIEISSDRAEYAAVRGIMSFSEGRPLLKTFGSEGDESLFRQSETRADHFSIDEREEVLEASGKVRSTVVLKQGPAVVSAKTMKTTFNGDWIEYEGKAQLIQADNLLEAEVIRINPGNEALSAHGGIRNILVTQEENETQTYEITSREMDFDAGRQRASYSGDAVLVTEGLRVSSPRLELIFDSSGQDSLSRVEASGGVEIVESGRKWTADRATYFSAGQRVVVSDE